MFTTEFPWQSDKKLKKSCRIAMKFQEGATADLEYRRSKKSRRKN